MSINHHYSLDNIPETTPYWWNPQMEAIQNPPGPTIHPSWPPQIYQYQPFNLNNQDQDEENDDDNNDDEEATTIASRGEEQGEDEKEPMFEKPLTPSDVGKLNRLVIPKQHAEKYFPLGDSGEGKGLLLSFEDESGKCWRFRYSYWNSSQSYVLTKGWSRYVKDKRLDAGDVVLFERHREDSQRLFIGWRRRQQPNGSAPAHVSRGGHGRRGDGNGNSKNGGGGGGVALGWTRGFYPAHAYPTHQPLPYQPECLHAERGSQGEDQGTRPVGNSSSSSSRVLRLFGVNMECQPEQESGPSRPEYSPSNDSNVSPTQGQGQGTATQHFHHHHQPSSYSSSPHPHMVRQQPYYY